MGSRADTVAYYWYINCLFIAFLRIFRVTFGFIRVRDIPKKSIRKYWVRSWACVCVSGIFLCFCFIWTPHTLCENGWRNLIFLLLGFTLTKCLWSSTLARVILCISFLPITLPLKETILYILEYLFIFFRVPYTSDTWFLFFRFTDNSHEYTGGIKVC